MTTPTPAAQKAAEEICKTYVVCYDHDCQEDPSEIAAIIDRHVGAWLPIEKAPKDGRYLELANYSVSAIACWHDSLDDWSCNGGESRIDFEPTHYRPSTLPPCPANS